MHFQDEDTLDSFSRNHLLEKLLYGSDDLRFRIVTVGFVFASACHLWLGDAWHVDWVAGNVFLVLGCLLVLWRRMAIGWLFCAIGTLLPILTARDQLTQSMLLFFFAASAFVGILHDTLKNAPREEETQGLFFTLASWRLCTILTYILAAVHKLNREFLDPQYSCAVYGWDKVLEYWHLPPFLPENLLAFTAHATLVTELSIAALHLFGRSPAAIVVALLFHIPLTVTMAPAFAFVMLAGHLAFLSPYDIEYIKTFLRQKPWVLLLPTLCTILSLWIHGALPEWSMIPKEWLLWAISIVLLIAYPFWKAKSWNRTNTLALTSKARVGVVLVALLYTANGLTPYLGLQYQHTAAMLSNLRIDTGCWNSSLFPESVRLTDDYIRFTDAYIGARGRYPKLERSLHKQLWSPPQLRQMRRNWCNDSAKPLYLTGTYRGMTFTIRDLCDEKEPWPFHHAGVFGVEVFGDYLRFQKNLERTCPQKCIH